MRKRAKPGFTRLASRENVEPITPESSAKEGWIDRGLIVGASGFGPALKRVLRAFSSVLLTRITPGTVQDARNDRNSPVFRELSVKK